MNTTISTLLDGYQHPTILSSADGNIIFLNSAAEKDLNLSSNQLVGTKIKDLFTPSQVLQKKTIWSRFEKKFEIDEEKLEIDGDRYIQSTLKPVEKGTPVFDPIEIQKEMAKRLVHRFNSPLNGVTGFTELLKDLNLTDKQSQYVHSIEKGLEDFQQILTDVHTLAEEVQAHKSNFDIKSFTANLIDQYESEKKERIDVTIDKNFQELHSDFVLLKTIITELLDNALEFGSEDKTTVKLHFREDETIRITNFGAPIPSSETHKIFYPFVSQKTRGIGLGLAKCAYYAQTLDYDLVLATNSVEEGISFDIIT